MKNLGTFEVKDSIVVVDPCYKQKNNLEVKLKAHKGKWVAQVSYENESGVQYLNAHFVDFFGGTGKEVSGAGVDSGQIGIWDKDFWETKNNGGSYGDLDTWYGAICDITERFGAGQFGKGAVAETGGDGCFPIYAIYDSNNEVVSVTVYFQ